jgi:hypothetical protein
VVGQTGHSEGVLVLLSLNSTPVNGRPGLLFGEVRAGGCGWVEHTDEFKRYVRLGTLLGPEGTSGGSGVVLWLLLAWTV